MRGYRPVGTMIAYTVVGALSGFVAWIVMLFVAVDQFTRLPIGQEDMAGAAGIGPSPEQFIVLMAVGCAAGAFFGWRLNLRRQTNEPPT